MPASARCWDFTVPPPTSGSSEGYDNPPGFEFLSEGLEKEAEYLACRRQQQQQHPRSASASAAPPSTPSPSPQALALLQRKLWDCAIAPAKAFAMNLFMLYMGGGSSGIFGVLILVYALHSCIKTLLSVSLQFRSFDGIKQLRFVWLYKCIYVSICIAFSAYLLAQAMQMGALPLSSGDYLGLIPQTVVTSRAFPAALAAL